MIYWAYLFLAVIFEVFGTMSLKYSSSYNSLLSGWLTVLFYVVSFSLMWIAIKKIDISIAYAIWAGLGTALISVVGAFLFKEEMTLFKAACVGLIIIGVMGLKYSSGVDS